MTQDFTLSVNGKSVTVAAEPEMPLLYALRNALGLNNPHFGCGLAQCGACTVHMDGEAVRSCVVPLSTVGKAEITPTSMANGAKELLDEVATGKVTGEEDRYSHTDLVDFKGNVEGAQKAYELLKPVAAKNDAALTTELDKQFGALGTLLDQYRPDKNSYAFVSYDKVTKDQRKELSDAVNALAEPLSKLAAAVVTK